MQTSLQLHTHTHLMVSRAVHPDPINTSSSNSCSITPTKSEQQTNKAQITIGYTNIRQNCGCGTVLCTLLGGLRSVAETYTSSGRWPGCVLLPLAALCAGEAPPEVRAEEGREQSRCQHRVRSYGTVYVCWPNTCINLSFLH